ncbi:MAG: glycosyltransferase family 4 protein [Nitrospirota bacterium]
MKIAFIARTYNKQGGISRYVTELAETFSQEHEVHVFTNSWKDVFSNKIIFHKVPMIKGNFFLKRKKTGLAVIFQAYSFALMSKFKINTQDFDIVHTQGDCFVPFDVYTTQSCHKAAVKKARKLNRGILNFLKNTRLNPLNLFVLANEKFIFKPGNLGNYRKLIAVSFITKKEIMNEYNVPDEDFVIIPHGVNLVEFNIKDKQVFRNNIRRKHGLSDDEITILFVAHEFKRKGLKYLIEALPLVTNDKVKILVVGSGNERNFVELAKRLEIKERVIFAGHSPKVEKYFACADIFCFPTLDEPFGLVIIEALACGLPTITSKIAGAAELMQDGKDGLLLDDPTSPEEIATKINLLVNNKELREKMSKEAQNTASKYSWQEIAKRTLEVYKEIVKSKQ